MTRDATTIELAPKRVAAAFVVLIGVLCALFWHFLNTQVIYAASWLGDWGHTFAVPLLTAYLIWIDRERLFSQPFRAVPAGLIVVLIGLALYGFTLFGPETVQLHNAKAIGIAVTLYGVAITACGWASMRVLWFPLLYLVAFGQFISPIVLAPITERMQDIAAAGSWFMFDILGFETTRSGNLITLESDGVARPLDIAEACSGMRMLMAFLALGTFVAWTGLTRMWQRVVLVMLGLPIAIVVNIFRITMQGVLDTWDANFTTGAAHSTLSMLWLIPALLLYLFFMWVLQAFAPEDNSAEPEPISTIRVDSRTPGVFGMLLAILAVAAIGVHVISAISGLQSIKAKAPLRLALDALPTTFGEWKQVGEDIVYSDIVVDVLGANSYIDRRYQRGDGKTGAVLQVHVAYYTGEVASWPHVPERCWSVHGMTALRDSSVQPLDGFHGLWPLGEAINEATGLAYPTARIQHAVTKREELVHLPVGEMEIRTTLFTKTDTPEMRLIGGYYFIANGRFTPNAKAVRGLAYNFSTTHAYFCKVQYTMHVDSTSLSDEELLAFYADEVADLQQYLLPELMRHLPDWPTYEAPVS